MSAPCWYANSKTLIIKGGNAEVMKLFDYSAEEFIGMDSTLLLFPSDRSRLAAIRKEQKWGPVGSFTFVRKDGSAFSAGIRWHQGDYRGVLCDCIILTGAALEAEVSDGSTCECASSPPS
jgi:PAS domain-containing protein